MITGTVISNGKTRLVLTGETPLDKEVLKMLEGASCATIKDNLKIFDKTVSDGIVIEIDPAKVK